MATHDDAPPQRRKATLGSLVQMQARVLFAGKTPDGDAMPWRGRAYAAWFLAWGALAPVAMGVVVGVLVGTGFHGENIGVRVVVAVVLGMITRTVTGPLALLVIAKTSPLVFRLLGLPLAPTTR